MKCKNCGHEIQQGDLFCENCGAKLNQSLQEAVKMHKINKAKELM
ncbi:zinc ribbon domain-containing protein [Coprobacillaceae bacterium CR2/5/TPMF4]|nr:zinc ribbon domain-containing protein [Coprobacillaceae bacterium CR2/5/TPMF4]